MTVVKIKRQKHKKCALKRKLKFEDYINCLEATQLKNKTNHLEKTKIDVDSFKKDHKELVKNNKLILQTHQRFKIERHNVFTEETNKIALSSNNDEECNQLIL